MFYSHFLLSKKGPLGTVWIAAHLERRLRKSQVNETDIGLSVDSILFSEVPIALRLSGHLLLGVVRIYARKVNYLYQDCSEALAKIKHAFRSSGAVDLPAEAARAPFHSITVPEIFDFGEIVLVPYQDEFQGDVDLHVLERDRITLHDPFGEIFFVAPHADVDEQFPDVNLAGHKQDMEPLLFTIPRKEQSSTMQALEEDVLPPMAIDIEMDDDLDRTLEVSFPNWMGRDEPHIPSSSPMSIDQTVVHVSTSIIMEPVEQTVQIEEGILTDAIPEVEKLRSVVEPRYDEGYAYGLEEEPLISKKLTGVVVDGAPLVEDKELPEQEKEQASSKLTGVVVDGAPLVEDRELPEQDKEQASVPLDGPLSPFREIAEPVTPIVAVNEDYDILASILGGTPSIHVAPTPIETPAPDHARGTRRKRKQHFDLATVMPAEVMKQQTATTDGLRRIRRRVSVILFDKWSSDHFMKDAFPKASLYGLCPELCELYNQITEIERVAISPNGEPLIPQVGMDATGTVGSSPEHADFGHLDARDDFQPEPGEIEPVPSPLKPVWSELKEKGKHDVNLEITIHDLQPGATESTQLAVSVGMEEVTAAHKVDDQLQVEVAGADATLLTMARPDEEQMAPRVQVEVVQSMDSGEEYEFRTVSLPLESSEPGLDFLADSIPLESGDLSHDVYLFEGSKKIIPKVMRKDEDGWSGRTRAVVQYLQEAFKALQELQMTSLSLEEMLENKTKKQAARMFFEIIVLKSQDYIGVEQAEDYGDISLTAQPKLLKAIF